MRLIKPDQIPKEYAEGFVKLLSPIAPHIGEELWEILGNPDTITYEAWPAFDESKLVEDEIEIALQVMGKSVRKQMYPETLQKKSLKNQH